MNTNNTTKEELDMQEFYNKIQSKCPVNIFNFSTIQHPKSSIIGIYLMCLTSEEIEKEIYKYAITEDIKDESILFFDRHHIIELGAIINGMMQILVENKFVDKYFINDRVTELIKFISNPCSYVELMNFVISIINKIRKQNENINPIVFTRMKSIMKNIWFIPYAKLDVIADDAKKMYDNKDNENGDNHE